MQWQIAQILLPGETVARGLKRLGGHGPRPGKRAKRSTAGGGGGGCGPTHNKGGSINISAPNDPEAKEKFDRLTESASTLVDAGEADVYSQEKEYFERCAAVYIDIVDGLHYCGVGCDWM